MPNCIDCKYRQSSRDAAAAGELDLAPKAECKQHTGYGVPDLVLLSCREHSPTPAKAPAEAPAKIV